MKKVYKNIENIKWRVETEGVDDDDDDDGHGKKAAVLYEAATKQRNGHVFHLNENQRGKVL